MQKVDVKFYAFDDSFETIKETFSAASKIAVTSPVLFL